MRSPRCTAFVYGRRCGVVGVTRVDRIASIVSSRRLRPTYSASGSSSPALVLSCATTLRGGRGGAGVGAGSSVEGVDAAGAAAVEAALLRVRGEVEESFEINHADMLSEAEEETARVQRVRSEYVEESPRREKRAMGCGGGRGQLEGGRGLQRGLQRETENGGERLTETERVLFKENTESKHGMHGVRNGYNMNESLSE